MGSDWAVLATGESMSQAVADSVRGRCKVVAVSDAYKLAPWADALVSADRAWWKYHKPDFAGLRYSSMEESYFFTQAVPGGFMGDNSGLLGIKVAVSLGAKRVLLLGFDMHGSHFFGPHPKQLKTTTKERRAQFHIQFARYRPKGVEIVNCTTDSALDCYPRSTIDEELCAHS